MKPVWTVRKAEEWLSEHGKKPIKPAHIRGGEIRYRIKEPNYKSYTTIKTADGVYFVLGWRE